MASKKDKAAASGNPEARAFIENFGKNAPHPQAMTGRYTFAAGDGFDAPIENVEDGWYTDGIWSVRFEGGAAKEAVRSDVEKPEAIRVGETGSGSEPVGTSKDDA